MAASQTALAGFPAGGCAERALAVSDPAAPLVRDRIASVAYLVMLVATLTALGVGVVAPLLGL